MHIFLYTYLDMYRHLWVISGQFKLLYHIKLVRILKYNMFLNYYRIFTSRFILHSLLQIVISTLLPSYMLLTVIVNKWRSQLELYVSCLCLSFQFNPTPSCKERARMQHNFQIMFEIIGQRKENNSQSP